MKANRLHHRIVDAALGLLLIPAPSAFAQELVEPGAAGHLFTLGKEVTDYSSVAATQEYEIDIALDHVRELPATLELELPGAGPSRVALDFPRLHSNGSMTWTGRLEDAKQQSSRGQRVVLALKDKVLSGAIFTSEQTYQIIPRGKTGHRLAAIDSSRFPGCGVEPSLYVHGAARSSQVEAPRVATKSFYGILDVLVVYTGAAKAAAGGADEIEVTIRAAMEATNDSYTNSEITPRLNLVHVEEVAYVESGDGLSDLLWLQADPRVASLRDTTHTDMVAMIVDTSATCGISFVQSDPGPSFEASAFQVTRLDCALVNLSLAHEFGHLQGAEHNPENSVRWPSNSSYPWSFGHYHDGDYRTVMSVGAPCAGSCPRQPYFSNAEVTFDGLSTGVADLRENYRVLNDTGAIVAGFRTRPPNVFDDDFESGNLSSWDP